MVYAPTDVANLRDIIYVCTPFSDTSSPSLQLSNPSMSRLPIIQEDISLLSRTPREGSWQHDTVAP